MALESAPTVGVELPVVVPGGQGDGVGGVQESLQLRSGLLWQVATQPPVTIVSVIDSTVLWYCLDKIEATCLQHPRKHHPP